MVTAVSPSVRLQRLACVLAVLGAPLSAGEPQGQLRGTAFAGLDTNAWRVYEGGQVDGVASLLLAARGQTSLEELDLAGSYEAAGRKFFLYPDLDTVSQRMELEAGFHPFPSLQAGVEGRAKDRRGGPRRFTDLLGTLYLHWWAGDALDVELRAGAHRFIYWSDFPYSFSAPEGSARVRYRFYQRHSISAYGVYGQRRYNDLAQRSDAALAVGAGYSYRGPFQLSLEYGYSTQDSTSFGETVRVHRLDVTYGVRLPLEWVALVQVGLQLGEYPDGVPGLLLDPDDEPYNSVAIKVVRPLSRSWDLELRYGLHLGWLSKNQKRYLRNLGSVGVSFRL